MGTIHEEVQADTHSRHNTGVGNINVGLRGGSGNDGLRTGGTGLPDAAQKYILNNGLLKYFKKHSVFEGLANI